MEELINYPFHTESNTLLVLRETETAARLHGFLPHLRVVVIEEIDYCLLDKIDNTHRELCKVIISQGFDSQSNHFSQLLFSDLILLPSHGMSLFSQSKQELLISLV
jgi:hypothetical protein